MSKFVSVVSHPTGNTVPLLRELTSSCTIGVARSDANTSQGAFALVFQNNHGFNEWQTGLTFTGILVGMIIGYEQGSPWVWDICAAMTALPSPLSFFETCADVPLFL